MPRYRVRAHGSKQVFEVELPIELQPHQLLVVVRPLTAAEKIQKLCDGLTAPRVCERPEACGKHAQGEWYCRVCRDELSHPVIRES